MKLRFKKLAFRQRICKKCGKIGDLRFKNSGLRIWLPTKTLMFVPLKLHENGADSGLRIWLPTKTLMFVPLKLQENSADSGLRIWLPTKTLKFVPWKLLASKIYV